MRQLSLDVAIFAATNIVDNSSTACCHVFLVILPSLRNYWQNEPVHPTHSSHHLTLWSCSCEPNDVEHAAKPIGWRGAAHVVDDGMAHSLLHGVRGCLFLLGPPFAPPPSDLQIHSQGMSSMSRKYVVICGVVHWYWLRLLFYDSNSVTLLSLELGMFEATRFFQASQVVLCCWLVSIP